jgi:hypothetical protein
VDVSLSLYCFWDRRVEYNGDVYTVVDTSNREFGCWGLCITLFVVGNSTIGYAECTMYERSTSIVSTLYHTYTLPDSDRIRSKYGTVGLLLF